ncbi:hypothetical protein DGG96_19170 [Legionella qingyii]|uniref:Sel1 repeat family protein n=1 Tax=Legionella qingyii TaxID=2184757 RepID=A0A317TYR5_9GAMM|nr:SEL1-like repeat protein [Legionella qingyii]PWY54025.1 hypothetical protein DGG96_19170 [Legionella qingyii]RUR19880.1 sel1 repeat family protein [Legionella qingyii]RUR22352.1 sel1 repeat family protein [Legionella qingyii]
MNYSEIYFGEGYQRYFNEKFIGYAENDIKYDDAKSCYDLAEYYRCNHDEKKADLYYKKAFSLFEKLSERENIDANYYVGYFYQYGFGVDQNMKQAEKFYTLAFKEMSKYKSNPHYYYLIGRMYESGFSENKFGDVNYEKAAYYYRMAASLNYYDAFYRLGYIDAMKK